MNSNLSNNNVKSTDSQQVDNLYKQDDDSTPTPKETELRGFRDVKAALNFHSLNSCNT